MSTKRPGFPLPLQSVVKPATPAARRPASPSGSGGQGAPAPRGPTPSPLRSAAPTPSPRPTPAVARTVDLPGTVARKVQKAAPAPQGLGLDSGAVRARMVQRLREQGVAHPAVLHALGLVERHRFVDAALAGQAYDDNALPIGLGQTISKPSVVARMLALLLGDRAAPLGRVLEIGTGCGYQSALLSHLAQEVYSIERLRGLHDKARENLRPLRLRNVHLMFGDGMLGYPSGAPYAGIVSAAGGAHLPSTWYEQLAMGGRLIAPTVTPAGHQALVLIEKTPQGPQQQVLEAVHFVPLKSGVE